MNNCSTLIEIMNESNLKRWNKDLDFSLGIVDLDIELRETKPVSNYQSTPEEKEKLAKWERSDRLRLCAIKKIIFEHLISGLPEKVNAKEYITATIKCVAEKEKLMTCETCLKGKQNRLDFASNMLKISNDTLEDVHFDICDLFKYHHLVEANILSSLLMNIQ